MRRLSSSRIRVVSLVAVTAVALGDDGALTSARQAPGRVNAGTHHGASNATHRPVQLAALVPARPCSVCSSCSQTPRRRYAVRRWYTVCQGPYRSGRSRHGAPVRAIQIMPSTSSRSGRRGRPRLLVGAGNSRANCRHCGSLNPSRCTPCCSPQNSMPRPEHYSDTA